MNWRNVTIKIICLALIILSAGLFFVSPTSASFNEQINYQGKLTDQNNVNVADGSYNLDFSFYDAPTAGNLLWTESATSTSKVTVTSGLFSHLLGSISALPDNIFNQTVYLEVKVGGSGTPDWQTLTPRKKIGSVPSAFEAKRLNGKLESQFATLSEAETVSGAWTFSATTNFAGAIFSGTVTSTSRLQISGVSTLATTTISNLTVSDLSSGNLVFAGTGGLLSGTSSLYWDNSTGRLGIGTTTPGSFLHVLGTTEQLRLAYNATNYTSFTVGTDGALTITPTNSATTTISNGLVVNTNSLVVQKADGYVGIGTATPSNQLHVKTTGTAVIKSEGGSTGAGSLQLVADSGGHNMQFLMAGTARAGNIFGVASADKGFWYINNAAGVIGTSDSYSFSVGTNSLVRMTVLGTGLVGIGTTAPDKALEINSATGANLRLTYNDSNGSASNYTDFSVGTDGALTIAPTNSATTTIANGLNVNGKISVSSTQMVYLPNQTNFTGSMIIGNGGGSLSHSFGFQGFSNTFVGLDVGLNNTTGYYNTANGYQALYSNNTGYFNTANGYQALYSNTTGNYNTANGLMALYSNTTGYFNTANGYKALYSNTTGTTNIADGMYALNKNITGISNTAVGYGAGYNSLGSSNVFLGYQAGYSETGSNKLYISNSNTASPLIYGNFSSSTLTANGSLTITGTSTLSDLISNTGLFQSGVTQSAESYGSNILNDGGLELWTNTTTLTAWAYLYTGAGTPSTTKELTVVHSGTSSLKIVGDADGTTAGITESIGSLTVGASYQATAWMKNGGSGNGGLVILNDFSGTATQMWSFASSSWVAFTGVVGIGADNTHQFTLSGTYALQTSPVFTVPASGRLAPVFLGDAIVASKTIYIDDVTLKSYTPASVATPYFVFNTPSAITSATSTYIYSVRNGSTPVFSIASNGDVVASGTLYATSATVGTGRAPGDMAERVDILIDQEVEPGDLMMVSAGLQDVYERTTSSYENKIAGVISTNPVMVVGNGKTDHTAVMALIGRVPIKVSLENGPIKIGDYLVASNQPGVAMRATDPGMSIGMALDNYDFTATSTSSTIAKILVYVSPRYTMGNPSEVSQSTSEKIYDYFTTAIKNSLEKLGLVINEGVAKVKELFADKVTTNNMTTKELCVGNTCIDEDLLKELMKNNNLTPQQAPANNSVPTPNSNISTSTPEVISSSNNTSSSPSIVQTPPVVEDPPLQSVPVPSQEPNNTIVTPEAIVPGSASSSP